MKHNDYKNIYIGALIKQKVDESYMSYAEFARQIHCGRTNVYRIFECKSIDIERLLLISDVLHYDFIHEVYLPQEYKENMEEPGLFIPFRDGCLNLEGLPDSMRMQIKEQL